MTPFTSEAERQRAREAAVNVMGPHAYVSDEYLGLEFDRLYPPVVEPAAQDDPWYSDKSAVGRAIEARRKPATPSPAFAAALDETLVTYAQAARVIREATAIRDPLVRDTQREYESARAALVRVHLEEVNDGR